MASSSSEESSFVSQSVDLRTAIHRFNGFRSSGQILAQFLGGNLAALLPQVFPVFQELFESRIFGHFSFRRLPAHRIPQSSSWPTATVA